MNRFDEMREAMREAREQMRAADLVAEHMADMLCGRLRKVRNRRILDELKRELRDYNMNTREWKS